MAIKDFYEATTKKFNISIFVNEVSQDLSGDQLIFYLKKNINDPDYIMTSSADVTTSGSIGTAYFNIPDTDTAVKPDNYTYEIKWILSNNEKYIVDQSNIRIKPRIENI